MLDHYEIHADAIESTQEEMGDACPLFGWPLSPAGEALQWYKCSVGQSVSGKELGFSGFGTSADMVALVLVRRFQATPPDPKLPTGIEPQLQHTCLVKLGVGDASPRKYRVSQIVLPPGRHWLDFVLVDPTRGV